MKRRLWLMSAVVAVINIAAIFLVLNLNHSDEDSANTTQEMTREETQKETEEYKVIYDKWMTLSSAFLRDDEVYYVVSARGRYELTGRDGSQLVRKHLFVDGSSCPIWSDMWSSLFYICDNQLFRLKIGTMEETVMCSLDKDINEILGMTNNCAILQDREYNLRVVDVYSGMEKFVTNKSVNVGEVLAVDWDRWNRCLFSGMGENAYGGSERLYLFDEQEIRCIAQIEGNARIISACFVDNTVCYALNTGEVYSVDLTDPEFTNVRVAEDEVAGVGNVNGKLIFVIDEGDIYKQKIVFYVIGKSGEKIPHTVWQPSAWSGVLRMNVSENGVVCWMSESKETFYYIENQFNLP